MPSPATPPPPARWRAPLRIDLAGGTLDIWPVYLQLERPVTVNVAIDRYAEVELHRDARRPSSTLVGRILRELAAPGTSAHTDVACPRGSGLGGSSALAVALVTGILREQGERPSFARTLALVRDLEAQDIRTPTGEQDYVAALRGGLNVIRFAPGGPGIAPLDPAIAERLLARTVLFYTGEPHFSGINNWKVFRGVFDGAGAVRRQLQGIADLANDVAAALAADALEETARLVTREWKLRKALAPGITTPAIERAFAVARREGALGGKVCGAGGGGCAFVIAPEGGAARIAARLAGEGYLVLPARLARRGVRALRAG